MKCLRKIIEYGLYFLVFLLPIQARWIIKVGELNNGPWEYGSLSLYGTDVLLIIVLLLFIVREIASSPGSSPGLKALLAMAEERPPRRNGRLALWLIGGLVFASAVSALFAADKILAFYKFGWLILGVGLFWLVIGANYNRVKLIYAMLAGMFLQAVLGIWQFLTQSTFANKWLGIALHNGADLGTSVVEAVGADGVGERWLRAYGGLDHPNILGGVMAIGILILAGEMMKAKMNESNILRIGYWLTLTVFITALFFSFSRSAWLGLAAGLAAMIMLVIAGRNFKLQKGLAEIILTAGVLLFILFGQYQNLIISRLGSEGRLEEKSTSERLVSYRESWQLIKNNWATGAGPGNYTLALSRQTPNQASFYYQPVHNAFLLALSEIGILGFIFFVGLIAYLIIFNAPWPSQDKQFSIFPAQGRTSKQFSMNKFSKPSLEIRNWELEIGDKNNAKDLIISLPVFIALIIIMSLDHWLFSLHFGVLFFWLVMGLMLKASDA